MKPTKVFFGYPSFPEVRRETVFLGAGRLGDATHLDVSRWEDLKVSGRVLIGEILSAIDDSELSVFDVSSLNQNVLFELGYAIGKKKKVRLLFDHSDQEALEQWGKFRTLTTVGYTEYANAEQIQSKLLADLPPETERSLYDSLIRASLSPIRNPAIFYLPSAQETEPGRQLTRMLYKFTEQLSLPIVAADPDESVPPTLPWYAQKIYASVAVIVHFSGNFRKNAALHNARLALTAGLAWGMDRPVMMLSEHDYSDPIDYRDLLAVYGNARACVERARSWLEEHFPNRQAIDSIAAPAVPVDIETELRSVRLGEHVAENESDRLANYFVETANYGQVLEERITLFVGRKGSGKTANLIRASQELRDDARNVVCIIKPHGYELEGLLRLLRRFEEKDLSRYVIESLWKYLLYSEIAIGVAHEFRTRPPAALAHTPAAALVDHVDNPENGLEDEFAVRLERAVSHLEGADVPTDKIGEARSAISEGLHRGLIRDLRRLLRESAESGQRIAVLVDNLDKAWDRSSDPEELSRMILGLLVAIGDVSAELSQPEQGLSPLAVSLSVFLRSDIYRYVVKVAREPDKLPVTQINWENPEVLLRIIEERYSAARDGADGKEIWDRFFCPTVRGLDTKEYMLTRLLPRPRDLVFFCNEAILAAVNAGHSRVEEEDILEAEKSYSQFALESILVENGLTIELFEEVLFEFAGSPPEMSLGDALGRIEGARISGADQQALLRRLRELSFLGMEVREGQFSFEETDQALARDDVLSRALHKELDRSPKVRIHPAFRAYLEVADD